MALEEKIRVFVKSALKEHRVSYSELAAALGQSESSVKRLLTKKKISMSDFEGICVFLGLSPADALLSASAGSSELAVLTRSQEEFLCRNPVTDYIFLRLMFGFPVTDVRDELRLSAPEMTKHLMRLERLDLIHTGSGKTVRVKKRGPFRWIEGGPFERKFKVPFFRALSNHLESLLAGGGEEGPPSASELYLSESSYRNLKAEINELIHRYKRISRLEQITFNIRDLAPVGLLLGAAKVNAWKQMLIGNGSRSVDGAGT